MFPMKSGNYWIFLRPNSGNYFQFYVGNISDYIFKKIYDPFVFQAVRQFSEKIPKNFLQRSLAKIVKVLYIDSYIYLAHAHQTFR